MHDFFLWRVVSVDAAHFTGVVAFAKRPIIAPDDPCGVGNWVTQLRDSPIAFVNAHFYLRNAPRAAISDAANGYVSCSFLLVAAVRRDSLNHRCGLNTSDVIP